MRSEIFILLTALALTEAKPYPPKTLLNNPTTFPNLPIPPIKELAKRTAPQELTINVVNKYGGIISMIYETNNNAPVPANKTQFLTPLEVTTSVSLKYPVNWAGRITAGPNNDPSGSKIEANYVPNSPFVYVDVSYVDGFSVPITCSCGGVPVTGCNKNLWKLNDCPEENRGPGPVCYNPMKGEADGQVVAPFFEPCQGAAYTFPNDNMAMNSAPCEDLVVDCCIGEGCPGPVRQDRQGKDGLGKDGQGNDGQGKDGQGNDSQGKESTEKDGTGKNNQGEDGQEKGCH